MTQRSDRIRVAVVGCGAVAQQFHIPILAGHEDVKVVGLVDPDRERVKALARDYGIERVEADAVELNTEWVDAALIATPASHHAPCAIELARRGIHLFVEKPMAVRYDEARAMVQTAEEAGVILAVGLFRRLFPSTRLLKALVDSGVLGRPLRFDVEDGVIYGWPAATLGNMRKDWAGGGALMDIGSHTLDRLLFILSDCAEILEYRDNALGGVESDCHLRLRILHDGQPVEGRIELSRTRTLRNTIRIECERGVLEVPADERHRVSVRPHDVKLVDAVTQHTRDYKLQVAWDGEPDPRFQEAFRVQIDDWLDAIRTGRRPQLSGASVLPTVKLVEACYRQSRPLYEPGVSDGLNGHDTGVVASPPASSVSLGRAPDTSRRVLVTGATGFIGHRVAEILSQREGWAVRALVRSPARVSRLARLPVEMVMGDIRSSRDVIGAVEGCQAVVHCAMGTSWGHRRDIFAVNVDGTRHLAAAALAAGVRRFVHLSSIAVHGYDVTGILDESTPVRPARGDDYSESKAAAEEVVSRAVDEGLCALILRPAHVYGPFSPMFGSRLFQSLVRGRVTLADSADSLSNTVYIDNVVEAVVRSLEVAEKARGQAFAISEGDDLTWREFCGYFAAALGAVIHTGSGNGVGNRGADRRMARVGRWTRSWYLGCVEVATSTELRALARKVMNTDPLGRLPAKMLEWSPRLRRALKVGWARPEIYRRVEPNGEEPIEFRLQFPLVSVERARRVLGYEPIVPRAQAMQRTLDWLRYARLA